MVESIVVKPDNILEIHLNDGTSYIKKWKYSRKDSWTPVMKERARQRAIKQHQGGKNNG